MAHDHEHDPMSMYSQETWDARYAESTRVWSGNPNQRLVEQVSDLTPGRALDVGCGEGADAVWLAQQGWEVTALDVSTVALERAAEHAAEAGVTITTSHADVIAGDRLPTGFDLVSVQFLHPPQSMFADLHVRVGDSVAPGGRLLVVGHHPDDVLTGVRRPHGPALLFTPDDVVGVLDAAQWEVIAAEAPTRLHATPDGTVTVRDTVVHAVRRT